ncbi:hypothetical protein XI06_22890 [Bradyrhizobium sp. CCBAU 11434]|nr:hypothetical protein [Bradyrhizobium sp. CCBAU 11434]
MSLLTRCTWALRITSKPVMASCTMLEATAGVFAASTACAQAAVSIILRCPDVVGVARKAFAAQARPDEVDSLVILGVGARGGPHAERGSEQRDKCLDGFSLAFGRTCGATLNGKTLFSQFGLPLDGSHDANAFFGCQQLAVDCDSIACLRLARAAGLKAFSKSSEDRI